MLTPGLVLGGPKWVTKNWTKPEIVFKHKAAKTFWNRKLFQKMNKLILFYYYETSGRLVFLRFLEEIEDPHQDIS